MGKSTLQKHGLGKTEDIPVGSGFVAPTDGFIYVLVAPSSSSTASYAQYSIGSNKLRIYTAGGADQTSMCPIMQGETMTRTAYSNCTMKPYFIPLT